MGVCVLGNLGKSDMMPTPYNLSTYYYYIICGQAYEGLCWLLLLDTGVRLQQRAG